MISGELFDCLDRMFRFVRYYNARKKAEEARQSKRQKTDGGSGSLPAADQTWAEREATARVDGEVGLPGVREVMEVIDDSPQVDGDENCPWAVVPVQLFR